MMIAAGALLSGAALRVCDDLSVRCSEIQERSLVAYVVSQDQPDLDIAPQLACLLCRNRFEQRLTEQRCLGLIAFAILDVGLRLLKLPVVGQPPRWNVVVAEEARY